MAAANADEQDGTRIANGLVRAFAQWCSVSIASEPEQDQRKIKRSQVRQIVNANIRDPSLSVESIARKMGVSTRCLQLLFARDDDCVSDCIRRERLRGCLVDLRDSRRADQSITDIAFSWGFNSASHFSSSFRKEYGLTARDYRHCGYRQLPRFLTDDVAGLLVLASEQYVS
jgi:transcriptional regulator GlxA family with amidase domain